MKTRIYTLCLGSLLALASVVAGQSVIEEAEYYFNTDPGPGNGTAIILPEPKTTAVELSVDVPVETIAGLDDGWHTLVCRFKDDDGDWAIAFVRRFLKGLDTASQPTPDIVAAEYYFDSDPGPGNGTAVAVPAETTQDLSVEIPSGTLDALSLGAHKLVVRTLDDEGDWSVAFNRFINRVDPPSQSTTDPKIARIDYQWLMDGVEIGDTVSLTPDAPAKVISFNDLLPLDELGGGFTAVIRFTPFDEDGNPGWPGFQTVMIEWMDTDEDTLPDPWEELYAEFGFDPDVASDPNVDSDEDGLSDYEEFLAGTNPGDPDSDGDGVTDGSELSLVDFGFDPAVDDADLLVSLQDGAFGAGLYSTEFQLKNLNLGAPVIGRDPLTGKISLRLKIQQSSTLESADWANLLLEPVDVSATEGDVEVTIPDLDDQNYFFRIFTDQEVQ
jgi:hypothetical protein